MHHEARNDARDRVVPMNCSDGEQNVMSIRLFDDGVTNCRLDLAICHHLPSATGTETPLLFPSVVPPQRTLAK